MTRHSIIGIDVGKSSLMLAFPPDVLKTQFNHYPTVKLDYTDPRWWEKLLEMLADGAIVAAEPTGHHLLAPVAHILEAYRPDVQLWRVEHRLSANYRTRLISSAKNDRLDAIAICLIAADIAAGQPPRGVRPYDFFIESAVQRLRMLINTHTRLKKENTRIKNRLNVHSHSLFPSFTGSPTWQRAAKLGYITPAEIKELAKFAQEHPIYSDGRMRRYLIALANDLPNVKSDPAVRNTIADLFNNQNHIEHQLAIVQADIRAAITAEPFATVTHRWMTLPAWNIAQLGALHVASLGNVLSMDKDQFKAAVGTNPRSSISGDIDKTRNTKSGYRPARAAIHMWAVGLTSPSCAPNDVRNYYEAVEARSFAAAKNKLARVLWGTARNAKLDAAQPADEADELTAELT